MTIKIQRYPSAEVGDGEVTLAKMAALAQGSIIVGGAGDAPDDLVANTDGQILVGDGTDLNSVAVSGDATLANTGALTIANDAVTLAKMADLAQGSIIVGGAADAPTALDAKTSGRILVGDGTDLASVAVSGNVALAADGTATVEGLTGENLGNLTVGNEVQTPIESITFLLVVETPIGAAATTIINAPCDMKIVDVWGYHVLAGGEASDTLKVTKASGDTVAELDWSAAANVVKRPTSWGHDYADFAAADPIHITTTDDDAGEDVAPGVVYILAAKIAEPAGV